MKEYDQETLHKVQQAELHILKDFMALCDRHGLDYFGMGGTGIGALRHQGFIPWDDDIDIALPRDDFDLFCQYAKAELADDYILMNTAENENYPLMTTRLMLKETEFREEALKQIDCPLGIFLDLYPLDKTSDDPKKFKKQSWEAWFWSKMLILRSIPFPVLGFGGVKASLAHAVCALVYAGMAVFRISKKWLYKKCLDACTRYNELETCSRLNYPCDTSPFFNIHKTDEIYPLQKLKFEDVMLNFPRDLHSHLTMIYGDYMQLPPVEKRKNHYPYKLDLGSYDK